MLDAKPGLARSEAIVGVARIILGLCFVVFGLEKLGAIDSTTLFISTRLPFAPVIFWLAVLIEAGLGALLALGFKARLLAAWFAFYCAFLGVVYHTGLLTFFYQTHVAAPEGTALARPVGDHFYSNMMIAAGFLCLFVAGPGAFALDNRLRPRTV